MELPAYDQSAAIWPQFMMPAWLFGKKPYDASLAKSTMAKKSVTEKPGLTSGMIRKIMLRIEALA